MTVQIIRKDLVDLLHETEQGIIALLLQGIMDSPDGWGEVKIEIRNRRIYLITGTTSVKPNSNLQDLPY